MQISLNDNVTLMTVPVAASPQTITVSVPGIQGPSSSLSIGTVTTGAAGTSASATVTGTSPNQVLNLTIPRGNVGATNSLAIGTVTTTAPGSSASATITGTAPSQTLNLTLPQGPVPVISTTSTTSQAIATGSKAFTVPAGLAFVVGDFLKVYNTPTPTNYMAGNVTAYSATTLTINITETGGSGTFTAWTIGYGGVKGTTGNTGPANSLAIGTVTTGAVGSSAAATITGTAPTQTLNLTIPTGATGANGANGPANTLTIGTVTTLAAGASATASVTGTAPNQTLNLGIPQGAAGAGSPDATTTTKGSVQLAGDLGGTAAAPTVPTKISKTGDTMTGILTLNGMGGLLAPSIINSVVIPDAQNVVQDPFPRMYHDLLAFNRAMGAPVYETSADTTTFTTATRDDKLFANLENQARQILDGTTIKAARWTWTYGGFGQARWLVLGHTYIATAANKTILVESSPDGVTWTTRHTSTGAWNAQPAWYGMQDPQGDTRIRLTIIWNSGGAISLSTIRMLTSRWGDQGQGSENEYPYTWDELRTISAPRWKATATSPNTIDELTRKDYVDTGLATKVGTTRQVISGTGLTGGGDLSADRTLAVAYGSAASTAVQGNDIRVTADQAATQASIRTIGTGALQSAAGNHTHVSTAITDSTAVGRSVLTAVDAPTARTAIGAGTSNLALGTTSSTALAGNYVPPVATTTVVGTVQLAGDLAGTATAPTVPALANKANTTTTITAGTGLTGGGDLSASRTLAVAYGSTASTAVQGNDIRVTADQIATQASIRTIGTGALQAAAGNHTHVAANITDSTAVGRSVLTAVDATAARTAISAAPTTTYSGVKTAAYTVAINEIAEMNVAGGATVLTLPAAPADKSRVGFRAIGATTAVPLTINRGGTDTFGDSGATSVVEPLNGVQRVYQYDSPRARWYPIYDIKPLAALDGRFAALAHTHTASAISDSTATGQALMTTASAAAARTTLSTPFGNGVTEIRILTQAAYTALGTYSSTTLYAIVG